MISILKLNLTHERRSFSFSLVNLNTHIHIHDECEQFTNGDLKWFI